MVLRTFITSVAILILCFACSKPVVQPPVIIDSSPEVPAPEVTISTKLYGYYTSWKGTPYRIGGLSRRGVDCSGFVYLSFRDLFGITLPRTTLEQRKLGFEVFLHRLQPGDLLFFKTGWFTHHVGIYLDDKRFVHASTSKGVMISSLQEEYWQKNFYIAKRLNLL